MKNPFTRSGAKIKNTNTQKSGTKLSFGQSIFLMVAAGIGLLGVSGWYWYQSVFTDPQRIISDMLDKSMQTSSVYRTVTQVGDDNRVNQLVYLQFTPDTTAQSITKLEEQGSDGAVTSVTTETIGTANADFVRYSAVNISGKNAGQNFESVLNTWGKRENDPETGQQVSFLNDALFVVVPFGNLNSQQRSELKQEIRDVKLYEKSQFTTDFSNGRPTASYDVSLEPRALVQVLAKYVKLTGAGAIAELNPEQYEGAPPIQVKLEIDMLSRHINSIAFSGSGRLETYKGYNAKREVSLPAQSISVNELQERLNKVEAQLQ